MNLSDTPTPARAAEESNDPRGADDAPESIDDADIIEAEAVPAAADDAGLEAMRDRWLRTEAELQNYRRRAQRDIEEARRGAEERALLDLIDYLDDLDRALVAAHSAGAEAAWIAGVELVAQRMRDGLARAGVLAVNPLGEAFDPRLHEALIEMPPPPGATAGTVLHVERTGYRRGDRVLRAARVAVAGEPR